MEVQGYSDLQLSTAFFPFVATFPKLYQNWGTTRDQYRDDRLLERLQEVYPQTRSSISFYRSALKEKPIVGQCRKHKLLPLDEYPGSRDSTTQGDAGKL